MSVMTEKKNYIQLKMASSKGRTLKERGFKTILVKPFDCCLLIFIALYSRPPVLRTQCDATMTLILLALSRSMKKTYKHKLLDCFIANLL